jgi:hypothetical protein
MGATANPSDRARNVAERAFQAIRAEAELYLSNARQLRLAPSHIWSAFTADSGHEADMPTPPALGFVELAVATSPCSFQSHESRTSWRGACDRYATEQRDEFMP